MSQQCGHRVRDVTGANGGGGNAPSYNGMGLDIHVHWNVLHSLTRYQRRQKLEVNLYSAGARYVPACDTVQFGMDGSGVSAIKKIHHCCTRPTPRRYYHSSRGGNGH